MSFWRDKLRLRCYTTQGLRSRKFRDAVLCPDVSLSHFSKKIRKYIKGIVSRDEYFFLKAYYDKYVLSVPALIDFKIFCFLLE
jgi:hypothetical protein